MNKKFCPNCGAQLKEGAVFCANCGFNVKEYFEKQAQDNSNAPVQGSSGTNMASNNNPMPAPKPKRKPMPLWIKIIGGLLVVAVVALYFVGKNYYTKDNQLSRAITAIKTDKNTKTYFTTKDPNFKVTDSTMKPLSDSLNTSKKLADFKTNVTNSNYSDFQYKSNGKAWLLFPKYSIYVKPVYPKLSTNHSGISMYVNNKEVYTSGKSLSKSVGPYVPGKYDIKSTGTVSGHKMTNENDYDLSSTGNNDIDLSLKTISFKVDGYPESDIYINDKDQTRIGVDGSYDFKNIPWTDGMKVQLKYKTSDGTLNSEKVNVTESDDSTTISPTFKDIMTKDEADSEFSSMLDSLDYVSSSDDSGDDVADYFENGSSNGDCKDWISMAKGYYKDDSIDSVSYDSEVTDVKPSGEGKTDATVKVTFTFDNADDDDDDAGQHIQVFQYDVTYVKNPDADGYDSNAYQISSISPGQKISDKHED